MKTIILQSFPNNEIRIGFQDLPTPQRKHGDSYADMRAERIAKLSAEAAAREYHGYSGVAVYDPSNPNSENGWYLMGREEREQRKRVALDITSEFQRTRMENRRHVKSYGVDHSPTAFTRNARHRILEGGSVIKVWAPTPQLSTFVTLTLPGSSAQAMRSLAQWSGYLVNRLTQLLRRAKENVLWFYSWEWQRRGALHLHMVISCQDRGHSLKLGYMVKRQWVKLICELRDTKGVDLTEHKYRGKPTAPKYWQNDVQECYKDVAAYTSKYVGKGCTAPDSKRGFGAVGDKYYPARWWGMCRKLKRMIDDERVSIRITGLSEDVCGQWLGAISAHYREGEGIKHYGYHFEVGRDKGVRERRLGWGFREIIYSPSGSHERATRDLVLWARAILADCMDAMVEGDVRSLHGCNEYIQCRHRRRVDKRNHPLDASALSGGGFMSC